MEIKRTVLGSKTGTLDGEITIKLTDAEVEETAKEYLRNERMRHIDDLLMDYGYPRQNGEMLAEMANRYCELMYGISKDGTVFGERMGALEYDVFEWMMEHDYHEIEQEE